MGAVDVGNPGRGGSSNDSRLDGALTADGDSQKPKISKRKRGTEIDIDSSPSISLTGGAGAKKMKFGHVDNDHFRKKGGDGNDEAEQEDLPHNLGNITTASIKISKMDSMNKMKRENRREDHNRHGESTPSMIDPSTASRIKVKAKTNGASLLVASRSSKSPTKPKKASQYGLTPGISPFPNYPRPTPEECEEVNRLLSAIHGEIKAPKEIPQPSLTITGCGEVPSVLDALIRTLLSGATTGKNSALSFRGLVDRFGILSEGVGKGSVDWDAVRRADIKDVFEAMKSGGLANTKSQYIKQILEMVYEENQQRRDRILEAEAQKDNVNTSKQLPTSQKRRSNKRNETKDGIPGSENESSSAKKFEIDCANQNVLTLDYVHALDTNEAMTHLINYPGIGPKTAACVLLFCLQRPCFAVDTHIFRICKWLGWLPSSESDSGGKRLNEILAFGHLDARIPSHLKYSLHQLLISHGKGCPRCRAITSENSEGWSKGCAIDHLVARTGTRKGGLDSKLVVPSMNGSTKKNNALNKSPKKKTGLGKPIAESSEDELSDLTSGEELSDGAISDRDKDD